VRQFIAAGVMKVPQNSSRFVATRVALRRWWSIPTPQLVAIVGIHDGGVVVGDIQDRVFSRTINIAKFDDVGRRNCVLVQQFDLGRSSSGFRSSSVKFAFLVRTSTLNIGRGCIEVSLISTVPGFSVKSPPRCSCIAPGQRWRDPACHRWRRGTNSWSAAATHKQVIDAALLDRNLRGGVSGDRQGQRGVIEFPHCGSTTASAATAAGIAFGKVHEEIRCRNHNGARRLVCSIMVMQRELLLVRSRDGGEGGRDSEQTDENVFHGRTRGRVRIRCDIDWNAGG